MVAPPRALGSGCHTKGTLAGIVLGYTGSVAMHGTRIAGASMPAGAVLANRALAIRLTDAAVFVGNEGGNDGGPVILWTR